jgi:hypothetical protein
MPEVSGRDDDLDTCFPGAEAIVKISQLMLKGTIEIPQSACDSRGDKGEIAVHGVASDRLQMIRQLGHKVEPKPRRSLSHSAIAALACVRITNAPNDDRRPKEFRYIASASNQTEKGVLFKTGIVVKPDIPIEALDKRMSKRSAHPSVPEQGAISLQETDLRKTLSNRKTRSVAAAIIDQIDSHVQIFNLLLAEERLQSFQCHLLPIEAGHEDCNTHF